MSGANLSNATLTGTNITQKQMDEARPIENI